MDDGSKGKPKITAGLDLGDRYSHLCLIDTLSGEVLEENRVRLSRGQWALSHALIEQHLTGLASA